MTRDDLPVLFDELGLKTGVEVGVQKGKYSEVLCKNNPGVSLDCVDIWTLRGRVKTKREALERIKGYDARLVDKPSLEAANDFDDKSLDFVYIDASHLFDDVMMDIIMWSKKVRIGGIVSGHDYMRHSRHWKKEWAGLFYAVQSYTSAHFILNWYITTEDVPSFFWVKNFEQYTEYF